MTADPHCTARLAQLVLDVQSDTGDPAVDQAVDAAIERLAEHLLAWSDALTGMPRRPSTPPPVPLLPSSAGDQVAVRHAAAQLTQVAEKVRTSAGADATGVAIADAMTALAQEMSAYADRMALVIDADRPGAGPRARALARQGARLTRVAATTLPL